MLEPFEAQLSGLISNLDANQRRQLAREIAARLRASQQKRIAAQQNPDGSAYVARKPQKLRGKKGSIKRKMFAKLRTARFLKMQASANDAVVSFAGQVARIAQVHQFGLRDKVNRRRAGPEVQYQSRQLLGFSAADVEAIGDLALSHISR